MKFKETVNTSLKQISSNMKLQFGTAVLSSIKENWIVVSESISVRVDT